MEFSYKISKGDRYLKIKNSVFSWNTNKKAHLVARAIEKAMTNPGEWTEIKSSIMEPPSMKFLYLEGILEIEKRYGPSMKFRMDQVILSVLKSDIAKRYGKDKVGMLEESSESSDSHDE